MLQSSSNVIEQVASTTINNVKQKMHNTNSELSLNTGRGKPIKIKVLSYRDKNANDQQNKISVEYMKKIKSSTDMSEKNLKLVISSFRKIHGKNSVEPGIINELRADSHLLDEFFDISYLQTEDERELHCLIFCSKLNEFIAFVMNFRNISDEDTIVKIGADGGSNSLKICVSLQDNQPITSSFKDSGVKKVFILAIAFGLSESYENLKKMFDKLNLNNLIACLHQKNVVFVGDLKILNLILGMFIFYLYVLNLV